MACRKNCGVYSMQYKIFQCVKPIIKYIINTKLVGNNIQIHKTVEKIKYILSKVDTLLVTSPYIGGQEVSILDITFSSMITPILGISINEGFAGYLPEYEYLPTEYQNFINYVRNTISGKHALKMYEVYRNKSVVTTYPTITLGDE